MPGAEPGRGRGHYRGRCRGRGRGRDRDQDRRQWRAVLAIAGSLTAPAAAADPPPARLAALVPADDARQVVAIGSAGEVYEPDGKGAWVHRLASWTSHAITAAGRVAGNVLAYGDGVVYQLADNGWSALRLSQRGKAVLAAGTRGVAAVGRQLFALDPQPTGKPARLAQAPARVVAIGAGAGAIVVATERGLWRLDPRSGRLVELRPAPPPPIRLVSERWAVVANGAYDLTTGRTIAWPADLAIGVAAACPPIGPSRGPDRSLDRRPGDCLAAIGAGLAGLELVVIRGGKLSREPLGAATVGATPVGVVLDRAGRAAVALADGRIALREPPSDVSSQRPGPREDPSTAPADVRQPAGWSVTAVVSEVPGEATGQPPGAPGAAPGAAPARSRPHTIPPVPAAPVIPAPLDSAPAPAPAPARH